MSFGWFKRTTTKDFVEEAKEKYTVPDLDDESKQSQDAARDVYRVGLTNDGRTTLTLVQGYTTMTLTMTPEACERMIRMLRATYDIETTTEEE
jgi:hypothetical protein